MTAGEMPETGRRLSARDDPVRLGRLMLAPAIIYIVALVGIPFALAIVYSLSNVTVGSPTFRFVGLANFVRLVHSPAFWTALKNTILITIVSQLVVLVLANILASALLKDFPGKWLVRLLILLPWVAPISLGSIAWLWMFDPIYSIFNWVLQAVGWLGPNQRYIWLGQPNLALASIIVVDVWRLLPLATVIILAGLSSIPNDILEAAAIDGAGIFRRSFEIVLPLLLPIMLVALLFGVVFTVSDLIVVFVLTRGGPFNSTQVLASWAYFTGIDAGDLADGAAISLFLFPVLVAIAAIFLRIAKRAEPS
ncbi:MAG TPA: sugar ABC transporter permease [Stellaceae bacterium]|jgi:multiple sugar transport system permease protein|nr:sugar ABC transporter permease [Stellaceae bacterium]